MTDHLPIEREPGAPAAVRPQCIVDGWEAPYPWDHETPPAGILRAWWDPVDQRLVHAAIGHIRYACFSPTIDPRTVQEFHLDYIRKLFAGPGDWSWKYHNVSLRTIDGVMHRTTAWVCASFVENKVFRPKRFT